MQKYADIYLLQRYSTLNYDARNHELKKLILITKFRVNPH